MPNKGYKQSKEHRKNISKAFSGKKHPNYGKFGKRSSNYKAKVPFTCIYCNMTNYYKPYEIQTKKFCSKKCKDSAGSSEETKEKQRQSMLGKKAWNKGLKLPKQSGKNHPLYGKKRKPETIDKIRKKRLTQKILFKDTSIEIKMQNILKKNNIKFETHKAILNTYQPDIFIEPNIVIECDGDYWHNRSTTKKHDRIKDIEFKKAGYIVLRFWEHEINQNINKCFDSIHTVLLNNKFNI